jgi:hypothetical protein
MSDDSFIREVEEELRSDRMKSVWERFGKWIIGAAVAIVLAVAGNSAWNWYAQSQATASGDRFRAALIAANEGNTAEARATLEALQDEGFGQYPVLARMREAALFHDEGDADAAIAAFDAISDDSDVPDVLRDMARLRAAYILVDEGSYADVAQRAEPIAGDDNALRFGARETLGLAAWKEQRYGDAKALFEQIAGDAAAPPPAAGRARLMLDMIRATGTVGQG